MSLAGIRVLELAAVGSGEGRPSTASGIAVAWVAKLFGDLGADVIRVESADGDDRVRSRPHELHRWLTTNKRSIRHRLDEPIDALLGDADLVVHDGSWPE
ncbi:MAG: CoA transferase, partial [Acidimicrobiales bacterium]|nr:CoA transferase [Acidimicrobiales bacterium]